MWPSREEDTMMTPTTTEVDHGINKPSVVEIDGFRGWHNVAGTAVCNDGIVIDLSAPPQPEHPPESE